MFTKILKIILFIISIIILIILILFSFFTKQKMQENKEDIILNDKVGNYSLIKNKDNVEIEDGLKSGLNIYLNKINNFDNIFYSDKDSFSVIDDKDSFSVKLLSGIYIFDFNNLDKKYQILSDSFEANLTGIGKIYIKIDSENVFIFSLSSTVKITFKDTSSNKNISSMYLFPHDYIKFEPSKNKSLIDADLFRIKTLITDGYIKDFKDKIYNFTDINNDFFKICISYINSQIFIDRKNYLNISSNISVNYPLKDYIERFFVLFINNTKKEIYYNNLILNDIGLLIKSSKNESQIVQNIKNNLNNLKAINPSGYDELLSKIDIYYEIIIKNNDSTNYYAIYNFGLLKERKINIYNNTFRNILFLQNMYIGYDFLNKKDIKSELLFFVNNFFSDFEIIDNRFILSKDEDLLLLEGLCFYLEKQISSFLFIDGHLDITKDISILNNYLFLINAIYFDLKTNEIKITGLRKNLDLLKIIFTFLSKNAFEEKKDKDTILINKQDFFLNKKDILELEKSVNLILKFFVDNKKVFNSRNDIFISKIYYDYTLYFKEYFLAITNYESYVQEFDIKQKELLSFNIDSETKIIYTKADIINYLGNFNFVDISNIKVSNINNFGFKIENYVVSGNILSFDIFPKEGNKIENISIDGNMKRSSYVLDKSKEKMDEKIKGASIEELHLYDFKNFFNLTFNPSSTKRIEQYIKKEEKESETRSVIVFKRDTLLGRKGEFEFLKGFLDIEYFDIKVIDLSNIFIKNASLKVLIQDSYLETKTYNSTFNSDYVIDLPKKLHYFKNIELFIFDGEDELFKGTPLRLVGNINLSSFRKTIENMFKNIELINSVVLNVNESIKTIEYDSSSQKTIFKFEKSGKTIKITLLGEKIISIKDNLREYISTNINISQINNILNQIK